MSREVVRTSYPGAPVESSCARKKVYSTPKLAAHVAAEMNERNADPSTARNGFAGTVVAAYGCTSCGRWHIGRVPS